MSIPFLEDYNFLAPYWLLGLVLIPIMGVWYFTQREKRYANLNLPSLEAFGKSSLRGQLRIMLPILRTLTVATLFIAMARPQLTLKEEEITADGVDIMMVMDLSSSMLAQDFTPDRLEVSKAVAADFIDKRKYDRIGLAVFSGEAFTTTKLQFLEMPFIAGYQLKKNLALTFGPYYSIITKGILETEGKNGWLSANKNDTDTTPLPGTQNTFFTFNDELDNYDLGIFLGYHFRFIKKFMLWGKLNIGMKNIFKPNFNNIDYKMNQFRFGTGISYILGKKHTS